MAKPGSTSAGAITGLILAASVLVVSVMLSQSNSSSSLMLPMAEQGDINGAPAPVSAPAR
jgi:hypothetical protein